MKIKEQSKGMEAEKHKLSPIEEYFRDNKDGGSKFSELFKGNDDFIDQMTQLSHKDIRAILTLQTNDKYFEGMDIPPVFGFYTHKFMRLMVSLERQSRGEYVDVHKSHEAQAQRLNIGLGGGDVIP